MHINENGQMILSYQLEIVYIHIYIYIYIYMFIYSGTLLNGPTTMDTHDITENTESPNCPSIHFNT